MQNFVNAPHRGETPSPTATATSPNAALLIDFDNVTMGIRSDLTTQLKELLNSDIIKGKVAVQRAYADWRRYAQYIVPLSEASVDLIFAPAYGSSKKNATDIRLAIDALELVFTRPEIGTYILLSGDSDFSSLVLKLKEYGKYVIGVGLRESASDLLVQNCDEYFSYSGLTGLTKAGEEDTFSEHDPWDLVETAVKRMAEQNDVMRSDRLKQVMLDLDPSFDEGEIGYSKFNKFLVEAASRNKLALKKLDNGQYEVQPMATNGGPAPRQETRREGRDRRDESARRSSSRSQPRERKQEAAKPTPKPKTKERRVEDLDHAYDLLRKAVSNLITENGEPARDSDIKRQILEIEPGWDESELGFTKFSRFLRQAHDAEVIDLQRTSEGYYTAEFPGGPSVRKSEPTGGREDRGGRDRGGRDRKPERREPQAESTQEAAPARKEAPKTEPAKAEAPEQPEPIEAEEQPEAEEAPEQPESKAEATTPTEKAVEVAEETIEKAETPPKPTAEGPKEERKPASYGRGVRRGKTADGPPPLLPGQVVGGKGGPKQAEGDEADQAGAREVTSEAQAESTPEASQAAESKGPSEPEEPAEARPPAEPSTEPEASDREEDDAPVRAPLAREFDPEELGLPTDEDAVIRYLSNSYQGVGQKTAEALIEEFGADGVFNGLNSAPDRVKEILGAGRRTELLLEAWARDYKRRTEGAAGEKQPVG